MKKARRLIKHIYCCFSNKKQKKVMAIEHGARFGNLLYFFLHAQIKRDAKINFYVLHTPNMDLWLQHFPQLKQYVVLQEDFKWYDNLNWRKVYHQYFGKDFSHEQLSDFITKKLLSDKLNNFRTKEVSVINLRRGDFYIDNKNLPSSFDQIAYVKKALEGYPEFLNLPVQVVSDDVAWCEQHLLPIFNALNISVNYRYDSSPTADFETISTARNLILTNSTFSYWGGYICTELSKSNLVIAPNFGATFYQGSQAIQLHPRWKIIDVIKNG